MQILDAAKLVCRPSFGRTGLSTEAIANRANIKLGTLNSALDGHRAFRIEWIAPITHATGDTLLIEQVADACGGRYEDAKADGGAVDVLGSLLTTIRECGEVEAAVATAIADAQISDAELKTIEREIAEAQHAMSCCLQAVRAAHAARRNVIRFEAEE